MLKRCAGCGKPFEARRIDRKWCSDSCSRRSRRDAVRHSEQVAITDNPVTNPDITDGDMAAYWQRSLDFARVVDPQFVEPEGRLAQLLASPDVQDGDVATESDWRVVQQALISRVAAGLERVQAGEDGTAELVVDLQMLLDLWADLFDPHVISALAASLQGQRRISTQPGKDQP